MISVDVDPNAIACARSLQLKADPSSDWQILSGSILDDDFLAGIPAATNVFSWGVLHHTGAMWRSIENILKLVAPGGRCCLALYNRPNHPRLVLALKRLYNRLPRSLKPSMRLGYGLALLTALALQRRNPVRYVRDYGKRSRGMSFWRDVEDWLGGLPYEYATPDEVSSFVSARGSVVTNVIMRPPGAFMQSSSTVRYITLKTSETTWSPRVTTSIRTIAIQRSWCMDMSSGAWTSSRCSMECSLWLSGTDHKDA